MGLQVKRHSESRVGIWVNEFVDCRASQMKKEIKVYILNRNLDTPLIDPLDDYKQKKVFSRILCGQMAKKYKDGYLISDWNWKNENLREENILPEFVDKRFKLDFERIDAV